jgi:hypothetical protein
MSHASVLGNSEKAERFLRSTALWAADCANIALAVFEDERRGDNRPKHAIEGAREFGHGGPRNKALRTLAWAAHAAAKDSELQSTKYAARSAMLAAAAACMHTDPTQGSQGINQARNLFGPAVYAALACEVASSSRAEVAISILRTATKTAPEDVGFLLQHFPPQPCGSTRLSCLFHDLDVSLRRASAI